MHLFTVTCVLFALLPAAKLSPIGKEEVEFMEEHGISPHQQQLPPWIFMYCVKQIQDMHNKKHDTKAARVRQPKKGYLSEHELRVIFVAIITIRGRNKATSRFGGLYFCDWTNYHTRNESIIICLKDIALRNYD